MKVKPFQRVPVWIAGGVILLVCLLRWCQLDFLERLEKITYDMRARQALRFPGPVATNLGFVFIDEQSVRQVRDRSLGFRFGLYWPRQVYGRLVQELAAQGAEATALDVIFGELRPDHPPVQMADGSLVESDEFFARQMRRASNVVLAVTREVTPPSLFLTNAAAVADISTDKDSDGILRRAKLFRTYRRWHPVLLGAEADPEYGIDLRDARVERGELLLPRSTGEVMKVPLDAEGDFALSDFVGGQLPAGMAARAKPFTESRVWHMGVVLAARHLGLDLDHAEVDEAKGWVRLRGPGGLERRIPIDRDGYYYIDWCMLPNHPQLLQQPIQALLLQNRERLEGRTNELSQAWRGKLAVVGSAAVLGNDLTDRGATPLRADTLLVSKHWNVANSILVNRFVRRAPLGVEFGLIALLGVATALLTWRLRAVPAALAVLVLAVAYVGVSVAVYDQTRYWLPLVMPVLGASFMMQMCLVTWRVVFEQAERRRVLSIFSTIVSPKIMQVLLKAESLALGGVRREVTVFFADVRGFTEFTDASQEQVAGFVRDHGFTGLKAEACFDEQARETLATVNAYLGIVADTVIRHDGTLDKYIGDCVMAFWGAPAVNARHAVACVKAAIDVQQAIARLNEQRLAQNRHYEIESRARQAAGLPPRPPLPLLALGTGINTGMVTVGLMGSEAKTRNYTVFGREVNLASRLEGASGRGHIYIGAATFAHLQRDEPELAARCIPLSSISLKGLAAAVQVYEVPWAAAPAPVPAPPAATV